MSAILLVVGVFTDAARINLAHSHILRANKTAISSLLACYNNQLKDEYGLFGVYQDNDTILESYESCLTKNLNINNTKDLLYDFKIEQINVIDEYNLQNRELFEKQIKEFMKYRAPYELASDLLTKVNGLKNISNSSKICERMFNTDKKASIIGELQNSLETKIKKISEMGITSKIDKLRKEFLSLNDKYQELTQKVASLQDLVLLEKDINKKNELSKNITSLSNEISSILSAKYAIKKNILDDLSQYKTLNSEAVEFAKDISFKKKCLSDFLQKEKVYINSTNDGLKEIKDCYKTDLSKIQNIIGEDNCENIISSINSNITKSTSILTNADADEEEFLSKLDEVTEYSINYQYNKVKPAKSDDEDNRDNVEQSLKKSFDKKGKSKSITSDLIEKLPSTKTKILEESSKSIFDNLNLDTASSMNGYLDGLFASEDTISNSGWLDDFVDNDTVASRITKDIYVNEYIMGTFKHGVPVLKGEKESDSYNLRSKDKTKRDGYFEKCEVEYIINGNKDENINELLMKSKILAIRLISNGIHIYTDPSKMSRITSLAAGLSSWSAGLSMPLIETMILFSWAMAESIYDVEQLTNGEKIPLIKTKEQWKTDISGTVTKKGNSSTNDSILSMSYHDYLKIFLLSMNKDKKIIRVQDLVQLNIGISSTGFLLEDCKIMLRSETNVSIKNLFISMPSFSTMKKNISRTYISEDICVGYY